MSEQLARINRIIGAMLYSKNQDDVIVGLTLLDSKIEGIVPLRPDIPEEEAKAAPMAMVVHRFTDRTGWTSTLKFGEHLFEKTDAEIKLILKHEIGHKHLMHILRRPENVKKLPEQMHSDIINACQDAEINSKLGIHMDLKLINSPLADRIFTMPAFRPFFSPEKDMMNVTSEQLYKAVSDQLNLDGDPDSGGDGSGEGIPDKEYLGETKVVIGEEEDQREVPVQELSTEQKKALEQHILKELEEVCKAAGNTPAHIQETLDLFRKKPLVCWKRLIRQGVNSAIRIAYGQSLTKLNRKHKFGFGRGKVKGHRCLFLLDTSGSMSARVLQVALSELFHVLRQARVYLGMYSHGLTEIRPVVSLNNSIKITGRGGTSVDKAFADLEAQGKTNGFDSVFIVSDFYDITKTEKTPFGRATVHWIKTDSGRMSPKWGTIIDISKQIRSLKK